MCGRRGSQAYVCPGCRDWSDGAITHFEFISSEAEARKEYRDRGFEVISTETLTLAFSRDPAYGLPISKTRISVHQPCLQPDNKPRAHPNSTYWLADLEWHRFDNEQCTEVELGPDQVAAVDLRYREVPGFEVSEYDFLVDNGILPMIERRKHFEIGMFPSPEEKRQTMLKLW